MEEILRNLLSNDGDAVREASRLLKESINKPDTVGVLCNLLSSHQSPEIRQYATIILRKRLDKKAKWETLDHATRADIKNGLLQTFVKEPEKNVKNCLAQVIGTILKHDYPNWNEIMSFLQQSMTSENNNDKELGFYMLSILTESCPEEMMQHAAAFSTQFSATLNGLQDKSSPIGYFIMLCMAHLTPSLHNNKQVAMYNELIPKTYEIIYALAEKRPDRAAEALDLYYELIAEDAAKSLLSQKLKGIVNLCLDLTKKSKNEDLQIRALNVILLVSRLKVKQLFKDGLMRDILSLLFDIMKAPPLDEEDEQYFSADSSEDTLLTCACETLDSIAINANPKKLMKPIMEMVEPALESTDPNIKKAGYLILGIVCQGCEGFLRKRVSQIISIVQKGIDEPNAIIRNAALFALGQMGEYLQPEISGCAMEVMPLLIKQIDRLGEEGRNGDRLGQRVDRLFYAIDRFSETLETSLSHFLNELMSRLLALASPPYHAHIRELAMAAIATAASSVEQGITPYFQDIMNVLNMYLSPQSNPETTSLQVEALDTLGTLARHVNSSEFTPLALDAVKLGLELVSSTDDPDIRKSCYTLFGSVSNVLKAEMGPLLQSIITPILNSVKDQQAFIVHSKDEINAAFPLYESDEENEEEDDYDDISSIENDFVEEKEEACFALKELALNTGESFAPFIEASIEEVYKLLNFPSVEVRKAALEAEAQFCISFVQIMYNTSQGNNTLAFIIMEKLIVKTIEVIKTDLSSEVAYSGLESLQLMLKNIGPQIGCVDQLKINIINVIKDVLNSKVESQNQLEPDNDDETTDQELMDAAAEIIPYLAKAMSQEQFAQVFTEFLPLLRNRIVFEEDSMESDDEDEDVLGSRANCIGVIAECMAGLGVQLAPFISALLPYLLGLTKDKDTNVRNNSLFTIGEMAFHGKEHMFQNYPTILNALSQVLASETKPKVIDNACGVIARMILTNAELIPLQQVFRALVAQLPLKEDYTEDIWVMRAVKHVIEVAPEVAQSEVVPILQDAGFTLCAHAVEAECKEVILAIYRLLVSRHPQECEAVIPTLSPDVLHALKENGIINI